MCDLIDLDSPNVKGLLNAAKLASPLIPVPKTNGTEIGGREVNSLIAEKSENIDSNPFDRVLHETTEYISKKGDPFEVMLQRALKFKGRKNVGQKTSSVNFTDDFTPKHKQKYLKTVNKTLDALDEFLLEDSSRSKLNSFHKKLAMRIKEEDVSHKAKGTDVVCNDNVIENPRIFVKDYKIPGTDPDMLELSILNQSAMNDTLLEPVSKAKGDDDTSFSLENDMLSKELILPSNLRPNLQRALSQGDKRSPMKLPYLNGRLQSATDSLQRKALQSEISTGSFLDRGFLDSRQSEQSVFSSLSNVSSVTKLTSMSSSILSNNTMNNAFLNSSSLKVNQEKISTVRDSLEVKVKQYDLSDLTERLNKLKCSMNATNTSSIIDDSNSPKEDNNKQITNDRLIDVDVFVREQNSSKERNKSSSSSDSVFSETSEFNKSIRNEAKVLARTFEEFALKTNSESSMDVDLISNDTLWMSELLPAFEDEPVVDNLIELHISQEVNSKSTIKDDKKHIPTNNAKDNAKDNSLKGIVSQFTDCVPSATQTIVTSLLSDLKKLIKSENNTEINKLLNNLEIALGANCKNNTELLITCLNISNELQNPQTSNTIEDSEKTSIDSKDESKKISSEEEGYKNEKSSDITQKFENMSQAAAAATAAAITSDDNVSGQTLSCKNDSSESSNNINVLKVALDTKEQDNQLDEKLAVELLMNLGKLLRGQTEDAVTMQLLKNIGKALNVASNSCKFENEQLTGCDIKRNVQQTTVKAVRSDPVAYLTNATHRQSFDLRSKRLEKTNRRSISVTDPSIKNVPNTQRRSKCTSEMENCKKRFSSDSEFISLANKKVAIPETSKKKMETTDNVKKEKPIAIGDVKSRLRNRSNVINKKGPMKAVHPVNNIQKRASIGKQVTQTSNAITPPKSNRVICSGSKIISSTPNSLENNDYILKKPLRSKPIASSTPDDQNSKISSAKLASASKNRNVFCDISPVIMYANANNGEQKNSPKRPSKLPTPKKCMTPKRQETDRIPRYSTSPKHNSSFNMNFQQSLLESPQRLNRSLSVGYSPVCQRKNVGKVQQSPLKENNRVIAKVKPVKLISKLKRHSNSDEKENNCS